MDEDHKHEWVSLDDIAEPSYGDIQASERGCLDICFGCGSYR